MKKFLIAYFLFLISCCNAQSQKIDVYPSHWWVGMKWNKLQVMVYGDKIAEKFPMIKMGSNGVNLATGVNLTKIIRVENPNYIFLDLVIDATAKPGKFKFPFLKDIALQYELKARRKSNGSSYAQGITSKDFIYLLMPDRFSNGDTSNDVITGMQDQSLNRDSIYLRHGGDLRGVINHLDYLKDLGVTTVWMTPVLENDMRQRTEHGYAITNYYKVDPRLGDNQLYKIVSDELHKRGMKLIQDAVYNHMGLYNFLQQDPPMKDWVHQWPQFTHPNYKDQTLFDPHVAQVDKNLQENGWFDTVMPDINQDNPYVANFLIQDAIWCVEEFGVDGWRVDTYIYCDQQFMNRCNKALTDEFPHITIFGEVWVTGTANQAYFAQNNINVPFKSNLIGVTDFQSLFGGIYPAIKEGHWDNLYEVLSNDFLYKNPMNNVIFLDNHDMTRFYSEVGEDTDKLKMGIAWLLTERGIPELYYGTEVLMKGIKNPDGYVRLDFPGGWTSDRQNKFTATGRTDKENEVFNWTRTLANFRKNSSAITTGKMMQYVPWDGLYVYFRYDDKQTVMVVMNSSDDKKNIPLNRFEERISGFNKMKNIISSEITDLKDFSISPKSVLIYELIK